MIPTHAMKRQRSIELEEHLAKKQANHDQDIPYFDGFSFIVQKKILPLSTIVQSQSAFHSYSEFYETISTFNYLSLTSKALNTTLNDQTNMFESIKQIADKFDYSHQQVAQHLRIKSANEIYDWQELLRAGVCDALSSTFFTERSLNRLLNMGADINFTYYGQQATLLAIALQNVHLNITRTELIDWLLANGAKIGSITKHKHCAVTFALYAHDMALMEKLFDDPQFNPHHIDSEGNTLIHHCLSIIQLNLNQGMMGEERIYHMQQFIEKLLELDVDISIKNTKGCTVLMMAKAMRDIPTINLLEKYVSSQKA